MRISNWSSIMHVGLRIERQREDDCTKSLEEFEYPAVDKTPPEMQ